MNNPQIESLPTLPVEDLDKEAARSLLLQADVIYGTDTEYKTTSILFGIEFLEEVVKSGQTTEALMVRVLFNSTEQLERVIAIVMSLKGSCHYGGKEYTQDDRFAASKVRYHDSDTGKTAPIPASELTEGLVRANVLGVGKDVWIDPAGPLVSTLRHPPFGPELRAKLHRIRDVFSEVNPKSLGEWEDGFRRDMFPEHEIESWLWMAHCYERFTERRELRLEQKLDIFSVILHTAVNGPEYVRRMMRPRTLSQRRVREIAAYVAARPDREEGEGGGLNGG